MRNVLTILYFSGSIIVSFYFHFNATTITRFLVGGFITTFFFTCAYFLSKNFSASSTKIKVAKVIGIVLMLFLIFISSIAANNRITSNNCVEIAVEDVFTHKKYVECSEFASWHVEVLGGEEARGILLERCLQHENSLRTALNDPHYNANCDVYQNPLKDTDWTRGTVRI